MWKFSFHSMTDQDADFVLSLYETYYGDIKQVAQDIINEPDKVENIIQESIVNLTKQINVLHKLTSDEKNLRKKILRITESTAKVSKEEGKERLKAFLDQKIPKPKDRSSVGLLIQKALQKKEMDKIINRLPSVIIPLMHSKFILRKSDAEIMEIFGFKDKEEMNRSFKIAANLLIIELEKEYGTS